MVHQNLFTLYYFSQIRQEITLLSNSGVVILRIPNIPSIKDIRGIL